MVFNNNKIYDVLRIVVQILGPLAILITSLGKIWGLPYYVEITATIAAIEVFLGSFVTASKKAYDKEQLEVEDVDSNN